MLGRVSDIFRPYDAICIDMRPRTLAEAYHERVRHEVGPKLAENEKVPVGLGIEQFQNEEILNIFQ